MRYQYSSSVLVVVLISENFLVVNALAVNNELADFNMYIEGDFQYAQCRFIKSIFSQ